MNSKSKPVTECKREFKLRQQYPSMIKKAKNVGKMVIINASLQSLIPATTRFKSKINEQLKNGFHKFRLKLPSGKDLGECNVQILPNSGNILKDKTVTIINQNKCKPCNKSIVLLNTMSKKKTENMAGRTSLRSVNSLAQKNIQSLNTEYLHKVPSNITNNNIEARNNNVEHQSQSVPLRYGISNDQRYEGIKNKDIENMDTDIIRDKECNKNGKFEHINIQSRVKTDKQSTNRDSFLELSDYLSFSKPANMTNNNPLFPLNEVPNYSINTSGAIADIIENNPDIANSGYQNNHQLDGKKKSYLLSMGDRNGNQSCEKTPNKIDFESDNYSLTQQIVNTICNKIIPDHNTINTENAMVIVHDNGKSLLDNSMRTVQEMNGKPINNRNHKLLNDSYNANGTITNLYENFKSQDVFPNTFQLNENQNNIKQNIDKFAEENHVDESISLKKRCSSCSLLKEIMRFVSNKNLEDKALKAFADCTIEKEQQISLDIPNNTRTVTDIKVQTESYSILESDNFLKIKEDAFNTVEIMPKEFDFAYIPENLNANSLHCIPFQKNSISSPFNPLFESDILPGKFIDGNVINDICNKHSTANKVKEVLSQPNVSCNKIVEQLQRDFETTRKLDENGMLNIHKAVINNRINDVQRYLMVFKACNIDVDILTQSKMTSLELAIKYNVSTEIVKLLLEAGANPASSEPVHDSALIIASRISSSLLPLLINHVSSNRSLDYMDFTGFAALHYCAQHGNLAGVNLLIKMRANVNLRESRSGRTPLFLAIENNHLVIAEELIENGAQADIPNFSGQTVMSLTEKIKHLSLVTLLHPMN